MTAAPERCGARPEPSQGSSSRGPPSRMRCWSHCPARRPVYGSGVRPRSVARDSPTMRADPVWPLGPAVAEGLPERSLVARPDIRSRDNSAVGARAALLLLLLQRGPHACGLPASWGAFLRGHRYLLSVSRRLPGQWLSIGRQRTRPLQARWVNVFGVAGPSGPAHPRSWSRAMRLWPRVVR